MPKWTEQTEIDLMLSLYTAVQHIMEKDLQMRVVAEMKQRGYQDVNWDMLRYGLLLFFSRIFFSSEDRPNRY